MLGSDVVVTELQRFTQAELEHLLGARRERNVTGRLLLTLSNDVLNLLAHSVERDVERLESLGGNALALVNETQQNVLGADVVVVEHLGFFLRQDNDATSAVGKSLKHFQLLQHRTIRLTYR